MHQFLGLKRISGPIKTFAKARVRLQPFAPISHGLDIADLLAAVGKWESWLERRDGDHPAVPAIRVIDPAEIT
jgi:hypothetical protein